MYSMDVSNPVDVQVQTNFIRAGENEFVVELPNSESINHIVVFLTGLSPFPEQIGGSG